MAFNFNWSPLIADTSRARDMLTAALNKSPKPPIIVDDILVNELNLGSVPPELDILEIGDLAEDRFRGIFKMSYAGDAFLTLKTRVQANPLNTYLSTKPSFASPQPLAAASGLTIPLQITLSDIRLSGFVILVFSRQKGITLVFRNDPLESLKVSSTFDSIPFVRDYLQKEIEGQLRVLFMEDLPAIIHRLSLRLWVPEYADTAEGENSSHNGSKLAPLPFPSPLQDSAIDAGNPLMASDISPFLLDQGAEASSTYSQRISLRLAALTDSYRTLSLFTPPSGDTVYRAWAGAAEHTDPGLPPITSFNLGNLARKHSSNASVSSLHSFSDGGGESRQHSFSSRPSFSNVGGASMGSNKSRAHGKKRKKRVVNLRRSKTSEDVNTTESRPSTPTSSYASQSASTSEVREGELVTPPESPQKNAETHKPYGTIESRIEPVLPKSDIFAAAHPHAMLDEICQDPVPTESSHQILHPSEESDWTPRPKPRRSHPEKTVSNIPVTENRRVSMQYPYHPPQSGRILEQAWMAKMAAEIARAAETQKSSGAGLWSPDTRDDTPPPAYAA